jgi:creatinine amidohydrolase
MAEAEHAASTGGPVELARLSWPDARDAMRRSRVALLPIGATEQHGPHLPLGTDWYIARHIARETADQDSLLLLPGFSVGVSHEHRQFWGTLSVSQDQLRDQAMAVARALGDHGLRRIVFVNGHGSNCAPLDEAAQRLRPDGIYAFVFNWWQSIASTLAELFPAPTAHAGSVETSAMLVIDPDLVHKERFVEASDTVHWGTYVEGVRIGFDAAEFSKQGNVGDPSLADVEKGKRVLADARDSLSRFCAWLAERSDEELAPAPHVE